MVGFSEITDAISLMEEFHNNRPDIFNKVKQAWSLGRPIKASYLDVQDVIIKSTEINKLLNEKRGEHLDPGGIYSIYSEKTQYGMGKSQFAYFIRELYGKETVESTSKYFMFSPSEVGFNALREEIRHCYSNCMKSEEFYFFIDELDLISEPEISEEEKVKRIEKFGNIIIETSEEAYINDIHFYIFLILSKNILDDFERLAPHRIKRRITPFLSVDLTLTKSDVAMFATNYFAMLWHSNFKNIQSRLVKNQYHFKDYIGVMITNFVDNLKFLGLDLNSSVIGDLVKKFRNVFDIIFGDVEDSYLDSVNFGSQSDIGKKIEIILKNYLLIKNKPLMFNESDDIITVNYSSEEKYINGHKTDGYYEFLIGDNQIGIMPVEITASENLKGRKTKQLKSFTEDHVTLLIWVYAEIDKTSKELEKLDGKVKHDVHRILIPRQLAKFTVMLEYRCFSLLEEFKSEIMSSIQTFLKKQAKVLYNRWMAGKPLILEPSSAGSEETGEILPGIDELKNRATLLLENAFHYLNDKSKRKHSGMKETIRTELKNLDGPLQEIGINEPIFEIDHIYREIAEELEKGNLCHYKSLENGSFLTKENQFTVTKAVDQCKKVIISRLEEKLK